MDNSIARMEQELFDFTSAGTSSQQKVRSRPPKAGTQRSLRKTGPRENSLGQSRTSFGTKLETTGSQEVTPEEIKQFLDQTGDTINSSNTQTHNGRRYKPVSDSSDATTPLAGGPSVQAKSSLIQMGYGQKRLQSTFTNFNSHYQAEKKVSKEAVDAFNQFIGTPDRPQKPTKTPQTDQRKKLGATKASIDLTKPPLASPLFLSNNKVERQIGNREGFNPPQKPLPKPQQKPNRNPIKDGMFVPSSGAAATKEVVARKGARTISRKRDSQPVMIESIEQKDAQINLRRQQTNLSSSRPTTRQREFKLQEPRLRECCSACAKRDTSGHNHSVTTSQKSFFQKAKNKKCKIHQVRGCEKCSTRVSSLSSNRSYRNYLQFNTKFAFNRQANSKPPVVQPKVAVSQNRQSHRLLSTDGVRQSQKLPQTSLRNHRSPGDKLSKVQAQPNFAQVTLSNLKRGNTQAGDRTGRIKTRKALDLTDENQDLTEPETSIGQEKNSFAQQIPRQLGDPKPKQMTATSDAVGFFDPCRAQQNQVQANASHYAHLPQAGATTRTQNTYYQSDTSQMKFQQEHVRHLKDSWDGDTKDENFWKAKQRNEDSLERHRLARETQQADSVLKQQQDIFRKLRNKNSSQEQPFADVQDVKALEVGSDFDDKDYKDFMGQNPFGEIDQTLPVDTDINDDSVRFDSAQQNQEINFRPADFTTMVQTDRDIFDHDELKIFTTNAAQDNVANQETPADLNAHFDGPMNTNQRQDREQVIFQEGDSFSSEYGAQDVEQLDQGALDEEEEADEVESIKHSRPHSRGKDRQSRGGRNNATPLLKSKIEEATDDSGSEEDTSNLHMTNYDDWLAMRSEQQSRLVQPTRITPTPMSILQSSSDSKNQPQTTGVRPLAEQAVSDNQTHFFGQRSAASGSGTRYGRSPARQLSQSINEHQEVPKKDLSHTELQASQQSKMKSPFAQPPPLPHPKQKPPMLKKPNAQNKASGAVKEFLTFEGEDEDEATVPNNPTPDLFDENLRSSVVLGLSKNRTRSRETSLLSESKLPTPQTVYGFKSSKPVEAIKPGAQTIQSITPQFTSSKAPLAIKTALNPTKSFLDGFESNKQAKPDEKTGGKPPATASGNLDSDRLTLHTEERLDQQLNALKYDQSNEGMSASFYNQGKNQQPQSSIALLSQNQSTKVKESLDKEVPQKGEQTYSRPIRSFKKKSDIGARANSVLGQHPVDEATAIQECSQALLTDKKLLEFTQYKLPSDRVSLTRQGLSKDPNIASYGSSSQQLDSKPALAQRPHTAKQAQLYDQVTISSKIKQNELKNQNLRDSQNLKRPPKPQANAPTKGNQLDTSVNSLNELKPLQPTGNDQAKIFVPDIEEIRLHWVPILPELRGAGRSETKMLPDFKAVLAPFEDQTYEGVSLCVPVTGKTPQKTLPYMQSDTVAEFPEIISETMRGSAKPGLRMQRNDSSGTLMTDYDNLPLHLESELNFSQGVQCEFFEETKEGQAVLDGFMESYETGKVNTRDVALQTSKVHFRQLAKTKEFRSFALQKTYSTDWALSGIFDEICCEREIVNSFLVHETDDTGNQVEEKQIFQATQVQILSQIECEYNADMLKRKKLGRNTNEDCERILELYILGLNTLQAMMYMLRLQKEWETVTRHQYQLDQSFDGSINSSKSLRIEVHPDQLIKLLTRCKKMYEAQTLIRRLLYMIVQRDQLVQAQRGKKPSKDVIQTIRRLTARIASQVNTLQEEHRIFRRPFILRGKEYLHQMRKETDAIEDAFERDYYVDETGTVGEDFQ